VSGWELFTWICVLILGGGSIAVFLAFLFTLGDMKKELGSGKSEPDVTSSDSLSDRNGH